MQIMLVFEIQIFVHQIQPVDFWFNISYSAVSNFRQLSLDHERFLSNGLIFEKCWKQDQWFFFKKHTI